MDELVGVEIAPQAVQLAKGTTSALKATALYASGDKEDVTESAVWTSANSTIASVSDTAGSRGVVRGANVGSTEVTADFSGFSGTATIDVTAAVAATLSITPASPSLSKGTTGQLVATATFTDGTSQDVTADSAWASSAPAVATVGNQAGDKGLLTAVAQGSAVVSAAFQDVDAQTDVTVTASLVESIEIAPANPSIAKGTTQQFTATAIFVNGTSQDVTTSASWTSTNATVATVGDGDTSGSKGFAQGKQVGSSEIRAAYQGQVGTTQLTVTDAALVRIEVSPTDPTVAKGTTLQFTATAVFSDGTTQNVTTGATWASSNTDVATISNAAGSSGSVQTKAVGTTEISASYQNQTASSTLAVTDATVTSIEVTPANPSIAKGTTQQFTATATFTDATTQDITAQASWVSSNTSAASVSNAPGSKGLATGSNQGTSTIRATYQNVTGSTTLTVTPAVLTGLAVSPVNPSIAKGTTQQFTATATFSDATTQNVTADTVWSSSDESKATVSNAPGSKGLAKGVAVGSPSPIISATYKGESASTTLTVTPATLDKIELSPVAQSIPAGQTQQYTATGMFSDGSTQDLTKTATWSSSNTAVIDVSNAAPNQGLAAARTKGTATIYAAYAGKQGATGVTVTDAALQSIQVTPSGARLAVDFQRYFKAVGVYSDGSSRDITEDVTWSSANTAVATINTSIAGSKGLAKGEAVGVALITAAKSGLTQSVSLTVDNSTLTSVVIDNTSPTRLAKQASGHYTATAAFSGGYSYDVTRQVNWSADNATLATISNATGSKGLATAKTAVGTVNFTATYPEPVTEPATPATASAPYPVQITDLQYQSITITPASVTVPKGGQVQFKATAVFEDGSNAGDVTEQINWSVPLPAGQTNVQISNAAGTKGLAYADKAGTDSNNNPVNATVTIRASGNGATKDATMTVTPAVLQSVTIQAVDDTLTTPTSIPVNFAVAYRASGFYSDGSVTQDLGSQVTWQSLQPSTVTVGNASPDKGYARAVAAGTATITATFGGKTGSLTVNAVATPLNSIDVTPKNQAAAPGATVNFLARGAFANGGAYLITREVTWSSSPQGAVLFSTAAGSEGQARVVSPAPTTITATSGSVSGSTQLNPAP
ncbi:MAG: Ig-like domain-containing protein [Sinimarinibacterium sp.]